MKLFYKSPLEGAQTTIMLAVEPELEKITGKYFTDCKEKEQQGFRDQLKDEETSEWLWKTSLELTGLEFAAQ